MPTNPSIILLDTNVVAGLFSITKKIEDHKIAWDNAINKIAKKVNDNYFLRVPTCVCYELMCWNKEWSNFVKTNPNNIFFYASNSIANNILRIAAEYSIKSEIKFYDEGTNKVKSFDPILAAYSLHFGYFILTENQSDFVEDYFSIVLTESVILSQKKGKLRKFLYLLSPKSLIS